MFIRPVSLADRGVLSKIATKILEPLYGDQSKALNEWLTSEGFKHAFVTIIDNHVTGLLSLKADPHKDFLKISTLVILPQYKGLGCGRSLLEKAMEFCQEAGYQKIIVTVSENKPESISFFANHGFVTVKKEFGKYIAGVHELIMLKEVEA